MSEELRKLFNANGFDNETIRLAEIGHSYWREHKWEKEPHLHKVHLEATPTFWNMNGSAMDMFLMIAKGIKAALASQPAPSGASPEKCECGANKVPTCQECFGQGVQDAAIAIYRKAVASAGEPAGQGASTPAAIVGTDGREHFRVTAGCYCGWSIINDFEWQQHLKQVTPAASAGEPAAQTFDEAKLRASIEADGMSRLDCGHFKFNLVGDDWGHFSCDACARATAAPASTPAVRLTLEDAIYILAYAAEGRMNTIKPDLLANVVNKLIAQRVAAAPLATERTERGVREACDDQMQIAGLIHYCHREAGHVGVHRCKKHLVGNCDLEWPAAAQPIDKEAGK
jgi:hypothetical protein